MNIQNTRNLYVTLLILLAIMVATASQTFAVGNVNIGELDPTFNPVVLSNSITGNNSYMNAVLVQPDGKIIYAGFFHSVDRQSRNYIARFNADGTLDTSFDSGGTVDGMINSMALQVDGKIVVAGNFSNTAGQIRQAVARLNADGSLDATFRVNFTPTNALIYGNTVVVQSDGKIIFTGNFNGPGLLIDGQRRDYIARVNSDGSLDTTFTAPAACTGIRVASQPDGKVITNSSCQGTNTHISRLNSNGTLDASFSPGTGANGSVDTVVLQSDGKILVGGQFTAFNGQTRNGLARLNANGSLDAAFSSSVPQYFRTQAIAVQPDGKILAARSLSGVGGTDNSVLRFNADGTADSSFNAPAAAYIYAIAVAPDGRVYVGGKIATFQNSVFIQKPVLRINSDGSIDYAFDPFVACRDDSSTIANVIVQPDGKILVRGLIRSINRVTMPSIARLNADGTLDPSFTLASNVTTDSRGPFQTGIILQPDGKILMIGRLSSDGPNNNVKRLNANGSLDTSFNLPGGAAGVERIALQLDGRILIAGSFTSVGGQARNSFARLNTDGSVDSFNPTGGQPLSILVQPDGKFVAGSGRRYNVDGTPDPTFVFTNVNGGIYLALLPDGKFIVEEGGYLVRVNADNTLDNSFSPISFYVSVNNQGNVYSAVIQPNGKILLGGNFYYVGNYGLPPHTNVVRLNANASIDQTFINNGGASGAFSTAAAGGAVYQISLQPDGKILLAGQFKTFNNFGRFGLARLNATALLAVPISGRVLTSDGRGLRNATVSMIDSNGVRRAATTSSFGFFSFGEVATGGQYTFRVSSRLFRYNPQVIQVTDDLTLPDFIGLE